MKKNVIIILCCLFALSTGSVIAKSNNAIEKKSSEVAYAINLGDVSELDAEALVNVVNESSDMGTTEGLSCTYKITIKYPNGLVILITGEGPCGEVVALAQKIVDEKLLETVN